MMQPLAVAFTQDQDGHPMERNGAAIRAAELETVSFAADQLGVSRQRIHQMIDEGKLDVYTLGHRRLIHKKDIDRLKSQRARAR